MGQGGLFGAAGGGGAHVTLANAHWSIAERMAAEKESFGFYFSAHPTDRYRHLALAHGARSFGELAEMPISIEPQRTPEGRRAPAPTLAMSALIEDARWRTSARGRRYLMATCSDASGQFVATCFDEAASADLEAAAKAGGCALLRVEVDRRPGEDIPRVTIRSVQSFEGMANRTRVRIEVEADDPRALPALAALVQGERGGRGELTLKAVLPEGGEARVRLGRDYLLDAELAARIERLPGVLAVRLSAADAPRLALVS